ncbi:Protein of uncharacterised function (DUF2891) [Dermatophilus congolensis]|uniref:Protein of uncharacterized function (DUF2891) n=1 Tax=Dermatophilus congolensis TaxID=1863 RepID=A0A239VUT6_9MICO|nr:DUF2891 family protein [Dermatophilus congolensis]SNV25609.1 Protein of uncharacterised function (DUF2891) [Dermatophilus congolensis]
MTSDWRSLYAVQWARTVPDVVGTEFPYASSHMSAGRGDCDVTPHVLHPAFYGALDWHSSCHMQWSALRLLTLVDLPQAERAGLVRLLDERLTPENIAVEVAYLREHPWFERPYGWGWAAMLVAAAFEAQSAGVPGAREWARASRPLLDVVFELVRQWLPRLVYPVRSGEHANVAFGMGLVLDALDVMSACGVVRSDRGLRSLVVERGRAWFGKDWDYPVAWEPGGSDFLSPALTEADLMRRILPEDEFVGWLADFLPGLGQEGCSLLEVPQVSDPADGKGAHLYGLALSRAAVLRRLGPYVGGEIERRIRVATAEQVASAQEATVAGDFMATHWLVSFALLAVTA